MRSFILNFNDRLLIRVQGVDLSGFQKILHRRLVACGLYIQRLVLWNGISVAATVTNQGHALDFLVKVVPILRMAKSSLSMRS